VAIGRRWLEDLGSITRGVQRGTSATHARVLILNLNKRLNMRKASLKAAGWPGF
jgi:hypothetical protein